MVTLSLKSLTPKITDEVLKHLCRDNPEARLEINTHGQLVITSPTGSLAGDRNLELAFQVNPNSLSGENILPGLIVDLAEIF